MLKEFKELKKELDARGTYTAAYDDEGRELIALSVHNDDSFLSPYSMGKAPKLSEEVVSFLDESTRGIRPDSHVHLAIHSDSIDEEEAARYESAIRSHYESTYHSIRAEKKHLHRIALIMALVAVFALSFMIGIDVAGQGDAVFVEVVDIFAWVFMWEAVDIFFLQCTLLRARERRALILAESRISFHALSSTT